MRQVAILLAGYALIAAAPAAVPMVQPGQWLLKSRDDPRENRSVCLRDVGALIQIRHGGTMCSRFTIDNTPSELSIHYTCPGNGHGRTTIKALTSRLIQIDSQGVVEKQPFAMLLEGRRVGECPAGSGQAPR